MSPSRSALLLAAAALAFSGAVRADSSAVAVGSAVTHEPGLPALGGIASLYVAGLRIEGTVLADAVPLPLSLGGVTVDACGAPAPLYGIAAHQGFQQVNFQVPWESRFVSDGLHARCLVTVRQGTFEASQNAVVRTTVAGDLFFTPDYAGLFQHGADYSLVTRDHPARPGEAVIVYAAALPQTNPAVPSGAAAPFSPLAVVEQYSFLHAWRAITLEIGGRSVAPLFVGQSPGLVGLYQLNFVVPPDIGAGDHAFRISIGWCTALHGMGCTGPVSYLYSNPVVLRVGGT